jgi:hypothetical protein
VATKKHIKLLEVHRVALELLVRCGDEDFDNPFLRETHPELGELIYLDDDLPRMILPRIPHKSLGDPFPHVPCRLWMRLSVLRGALVVIVNFDALLTKLGDVFCENRSEVACLILC